MRHHWLGLTQHANAREEDRQGEDQRVPIRDKCTESASPMKGAMELYEVGNRSFLISNQLGGLSDA